MKKLVLAGAALVATSLPSFAADLPVKAAIVAPPPSWAGFYLGFNLGYGWGAESNDSGLSTTDVTITNLGDSLQPYRGSLGSYTPEGGFVGLQAGYNWQSGALVFGIEADAQASAIGDSVSGRYPIPFGNFALNVVGSAGVDLNAFGTVRARIGWANNAWLLYATGGFAWGVVDFSQTALELVAPIYRTMISRDDDFRAGWTVGGGFEYRFAPAWSLKVEYQYIDLGSFTESAPVTFIATGLPNGTDIATGSPVDLRIHTARVGVNYRFGP